MALEMKKLNSREKVAVLCLCLDESVVSEIFGQLRDDEVKEVSRILKGINNVPVEEVQQTMAEFYSTLLETAGESQGQLSIDGPQMAERLIARSLPYERAAQLQDRVETPDEENEAVAGVINAMEPKALYLMIKEEHPQFAAIILSLARVKLAREVLKLMDEERRPEIIGRMAKMEELSEQAVSLIRDYLDAKRTEIASGVTFEERKVAVGGIDRAIKMLKSLPMDQSVKIIDGIAQVDESLGWTIEKQMITLEDIVRADGMGMRELLRSITTDDLKVALKDMPAAVQEKFFESMSTRAAAILKEDMEVLPAQRVEEVERAQKVIIDQVKRLIGEGKLTLKLIEED